MRGSWQTKAAGVCGALGALLLVVGDALRSPESPAPVPGLSAPDKPGLPTTDRLALVIALLANAWGNFVSRQNGVPSEVACPKRLAEVK